MAHRTLTKSDREAFDTARLAITNARKLQRGWETMARTLARKRNLKIKLTGEGTACTDGKTIYLKVPAELGKELKHNPSLCQQRNERDVPLCEACAVLEDVNITVIHEVAHIVHETFEEPSAFEKAEVLRRAIATEAADNPQSRRAQILRDRIMAASKEKKSDYLNLADLISPYLPFIINAMEDVRVNRFMQEERPGTIKSFRGQIYRTLADGILRTDGTRALWSEQPPNAQAAIYIFLAASGYGDLTEFLSSEVKDVLAGDEELSRLIEETATTKTAHDVYSLSFKVLESLRRLGFCKSPEDPEDEQPQDQPDNSAPSEETQDAQDANNDPGEGSEGGSGDKSPNDDSDDSAGDDSDGSSSESNDSGEEDQDASGGEGDSDGGGDNEVSDDSSGSSGADESDGSSDAEGNEGGGEPSGSGADADNEAGDSAGGDPEDEGSTQGGHGSDPSPSGEGAGGEPGEPTEPASADEGQPSSESSTPSGLAEPGSQEAVQDGPGGDGNEAPVPTTGGDENGRQDADRDTPGESPSDAPAYTQEDQERDGTPEDMEGLLQIVGQHSDKHQASPSGKQEVDLAPYIEVSLDQIDFFDSPSLNVAGVQVRHYGEQHPAWQDYGSRHSAVIDTKPDERVISGSLSRLRKVFQDNARAKKESNLRHGKVNARTLAARVPVGDDRLFKRSIQPGRKDYFVLIGIDCSGSTSSQYDRSYRPRLALMKESAAAMAEMLSRLGVTFAVYAHSGSYEAVEIFEIKTDKEPWGSKQREALANLQPYSGNLDGHTLEYYRKVTERRSETDRLILYYTDGAMPASNYGEELEVLQREIEICKRRQIHLVGVGVNSDSPLEHGLDTILVDTLDDIKVLVRGLEKRMS